MTDTEIVDLLAKSDPVYEVPGMMGRRRCAVCRAEGPPNTENVVHNVGCAWLLAMKSRDPYEPGGKWDRRQCVDCRNIFENPTDLNVSRICAPCMEKRKAR